MMTSHLTYNNNVIVISATEFKAKCLELLDRVSQGEVIRVTKRGKVVAELKAPARRSSGARAGFAREQIKILGDLIQPIGVDWEALK